MSFGGLGGIERNTTNPGVYLGTITRVAGATAYVEVPHLAPGFEYPARYPAEYVGSSLLAPGDDVAVAFLEGGRDELVVLIRLA